MLSMSRALILCVAVLVALLAMAVPLMSVVAQEPSSSVEPSSSAAAVEPSSSAAVEPSSSAAVEPSSSVAVEPSSSVAVEPSSSVREEPSSSAATASSSVTAEPSSSAATASSSVELSSSGLELSSSAPLASSSVAIPVPNFNLAAFAAFYVNSSFQEGPPAFVLDLTDVTADSSCHTNVTANTTLFKSYFLAACSGETSKLTLSAFLFGAIDACNTTAGEYYNVSAANADPTSYYQYLFPVSYTQVDADGKTASTGEWYAYVQCPAAPAPSSSSDDSKIGVVIGGVVIGVIVVFIVIALLYSRRNRKTVDQTGAPIATDANQAYSRL